MKEQKEPENNRNDKEVKTLNFKELQERAKGRNFDQITVVSRDIFQELANLSLVFPVAPGKVRTGTEPSWIDSGKTGNYLYTDVHHNILPEYLLTGGAAGGGRHHLPAVSGPVWRGYLLCAGANSRPDVGYHFSQA